MQLMSAITVEPKTFNNRVDFERVVWSRQKKWLFANVQKPSVFGTLPTGGSTDQSPLWCSIKRTYNFAQQPVRIAKRESQSVPNFGQDHCLVLSYDTRNPVHQFRRTAPQCSCQCLYSAPIDVFRKPTPQITGRPHDVVAALLILFLVNLAAHRCYFSGDVDFSKWGLQGWLAGIGIWYLAVTIMTIFVRREAAIGTVFVIVSMTLSVGLVLSTGLYLVFWTVLPPMISYVLFLAYGLVPFITAMIAFTMVE